MNNATELDAAPDSFVDLPLQPTGSGVTDLEVAYEQMKVAEGEDAAAVRADDDVTDPAVGLGGAEAKGGGHPS